MTALTSALQELARARPQDFVAERTRLAEELRKTDESAAAALGRRRKPTASVWAVNQLYWNAREAFDALLASAAPLRKGDVRSAGAYRKALGEMRREAAAVLKSGGFGASDATLTRIERTLAAIAAAGGFGAEPPGALAEDLAPPGFDAIEAFGARPERATKSRLTLVKRPAAPAAALSEAGAGAKPGAPGARAAEAKARRHEEEERERSARAEAEARAAAKARAEEEARRKAKRVALERAIEAARRNVDRYEAAVAGHREKLEAAQQQLADARATAAKLERELAQID